MNTRDPLDEFRDHKQRNGREAGDPTSLPNIDQMLEQFDQVFRSSREAESARHDVETGAVNDIRDGLRRILVELDRLECRPLEGADCVRLAEFIVACRSRALDVLRSLDGKTRAQAGAEIEVELDWNRLHEFMLCPEIDGL